MSLTSGHQLIYNWWTELSLPQDMIDHVNTLGHCSQAHHDLAFASQDDSPIIDVDDPDDDPFDSDYESSDSVSAANHDDDLSFVFDGDLTAAGVEDNANDANNTNNANNNYNNDDDVVSLLEQLNIDIMVGLLKQLMEDDHNPEEHEIEEQEIDENIEDAYEESESEEEEQFDNDNEDSREMPGVDAGDHTEHEGVVQITGVGEPLIKEEDEDSYDEEDGIKAKMTQKYGTRRHDHNLQPRKPCDFSHLYSNLEHMMLTQYNIKKGLKLFSEEAGADVIVIKMQQLHDREVITLKHANMLMQEEKQ